jgi:hypothetical protein
LEEGEGGRGRGRERMREEQKILKERKENKC